MISRMKITTAKTRLSNAAEKISYSQWMYLRVNISVSINGTESNMKLTIENIKIVLIIVLNFVSNAAFVFYSKSE
jgi:hypothetical protein